MDVHEIRSEIVPRFDGKQDHSIALIGVGAIAQYAHLPAYRGAGFHIVAAADVNEQTLQTAARKFEIERTYLNAVEMIEKEKPDIVDIAVDWVEPGLKYDLVARAVEGGSHVLIQKPFASTLAECVRMVALADSKGVKLAVNQQARWGPAFYGAKRLCDLIDLGMLQTIWLGIRAPGPFHNAVFGATVHQLDLMRYFFGEEPESVFASFTEVEDSECAVSAILTFSGQRRGIVADDFNYPFTVDWHFKIRGTNGLITGTDFYGLPEIRPRLEGVSEKTQNLWVRVDPLPYAYIPDAFAMVMADLMDAIDKDRDPVTSGRDNLNTIALCQAVCKSAETGTSVSVQEFLAGGAVPST